MALLGVTISLVIGAKSTNHKPGSKLSNWTSDATAIVSKTMLPA